MYKVVQYSAILILLLIAFSLIDRKNFVLVKLRVNQRKSECILKWQFRTTQRLENDIYITNLVGIVSYSTRARCILWVYRTIFSFLYFKISLKTFLQVIERELSGY